MSKLTYLFFVKYNCSSNSLEHILCQVCLHTKIDKDPFSALMELLGERDLHQSRCYNRVGAVIQVWKMCCGPAGERTFNSA